jgi:hypothetical protein
MNVVSMTINTDAENVVFDSSGWLFRISVLPRRGDKPDLGSNNDQGENPSSTANGTGNSYPARMFCEVPHEMG